MAGPGVEAEETIVHKGQHPWGLLGAYNPEGVSDNKHGK